MRFICTLLPVLALACGGSSKPPPAAPLPPEEGAAGAEGAGETGEPTGGGEAGGTVAAGDPICPAPADDGTTPPPATQAEIDAMSARGISMMEKMAGIFEADAADCPKLAADLRTFLKDNCTEFNEFRSFSKRTTKQQQEAFNAKYSDKMMAIGMKMMPAIEKCQNDAALMDVMSQMQ